MQPVVPVKQRRLIGRAKARPYQRRNESRIMPKD